MSRPLFSYGNVVFHKNSCIIKDIVFTGGVVRIMNIPEDFLMKMKALLKEEFDAFHRSYSQEKKQGLRVNTLKISMKEFFALNSFSLDQIPWVKEGFFYGEQERPGKHPYHDAGLYYIQEPSAMAVGEFVNPKPGEKVLDLCAAPGGKTSHIAAKMEQQGLLIANEIHPARAKILSHNIERMGIKNAVVTNEAPERLAAKFPCYFDRILVDAPCSGEGMFRKDPEACSEWSVDNVEICANRQFQILEDAAVMLKPGGRLVYSTCTFSPEENEGVISSFIRNNPCFELEHMDVYSGFSKGRSDWVSEYNPDVEKTIRLWPHQIQGEGHFIAVLLKAAGEELPKYNYLEPLKDKNIVKEYFSFAKEALQHTPKGNYILFGEQLYIVPDEMLSLKSLKVLRPGWHLGTIKKNRFEPSHALAISLRREEVNYHWNIESTSEEIKAYLRGEALHGDGPKGWYLIEVDGYSLGWGKLSNHQLKNHYPKGLRWKG